MKIEPKLSADEKLCNFNEAKVERVKFFIYTYKYLLVISSLVMLVRIVKLFY